MHLTPSLTDKRLGESPLELRRLPKHPYCQLGFLCIVTSLSSGCTPNPVRSPNGLQPAPSVPSKVIAQGLILPAGGFIKLSAPPGDVVEHVLVSVGDEVVAGQTLLHMRSEQITEAQLDTLRKRREEAEQQRDNAIAQASRQVNAAKLKLEQLDAQQASLAGREQLLEYAQEQVAASEQLLSKLESISRAVATSEFVGQLEIDRQRITLREAQLNYRQQVAAHRQAEEDLQWARRAALEEKSASESALRAAETSAAIEVLDLEIQALSKQANAARVVAPTQGVILVAYAKKGEASMQLPLIEMADLRRLVCEIEINEMDATNVLPGQAATITSRALGNKVLQGQVVKKFMLVGRPQLRPMDPLARADYRTVTAVVELQAESVETARDWLQLQVEVEIAIEAPAANRNTTTRQSVGTDEPAAANSPHRASRLLTYNY